MNNMETGRRLLSEAEADLARVQSEYESNRWNRVVRASQEAVEHCLKGLLKMIGVEYPKVHDVGMLLERACKEKGLPVAPDLLREISEISTALAEQRAPAFYLERDYSQEEAEQARHGAERVVSEARPMAALFEGQQSTP